MLKYDKQLDVNRALITEMSQRMKGRSCIRLRHEESFAKNETNDDNDCDYHNHHWLIYRQYN